MGGEGLNLRKGNSLGARALAQYYCACLYKLDHGRAKANLVHCWIEPHTTAGYALGHTSTSLCAKGKRGDIRIWVQRLCASVFACLPEPTRLSQCNPAHIYFDPFKVFTYFVLLTIAALSY